MQSNDHPTSDSFNTVPSTYVRWPSTACSGPCFPLQHPHAPVPSAPPPAILYLQLPHRATCSVLNLPTGCFCGLNTAALGGQLLNSSQPKSCSVFPSQHEYSFLQNAFPTPRLVFLHSACYPSPLYLFHQTIIIMGLLDSNHVHHLVWMSRWKNKLLFWCALSLSFSCSFLPLLLHAVIMWWAHSLCWPLCQAGEYSTE